MNKRAPCRLPSSICLSLSSAMWILVTAATGMAQSQQLPAATGVAQNATEAEVAPRGQHTPRDIKYSGWRKLCFRPPGATMVCRITSSGTWDTGQTAVRVDLVEGASDDKSRLQIFLPVGLYLQSGVKVTVDEGTPTQIPYSWCLANACVAGAPVTRDMAHELDSGRKLTIEVVNSNILTLTTSLSLDQFAAVRKGAPAEIFEYQFDND